jgi:hypothetical protein
MRADPSAEAGVRVAGKRFAVNLAPARAAVQYIGEAGAKDAFVPSAADIAALESALPARLAQYPAPQGRKPLAERAPEYYAQYVGIATNDGKRLVWGNYLCAVDEVRLKDGHLVTAFERLTTDVVQVSDGGDCFFHATFDLEKKQIVSFRINGEA